MKTAVSASSRIGRPAPREDRNDTALWRPEESVGYDRRLDADGKQTLTALLDRLLAPPTAAN
jgi:hypothetical protein